MFGGFRGGRLRKKSGGPKKDGKGRKKVTVHGFTPREPHGRGNFVSVSALLLISYFILCISGDATAVVHAGKFVYSMRYILVTKYFKYTPYHEEAKQQSDRRKRKKKTTQAIKQLRAGPSLDEPRVARSRNLGKLVTLGTLGPVGTRH
jgi:hypothetical protein